jgi:hypothetical protein
MISSSSIQDVVRIDGRLVYKGVDNVWKQQVVGEESGGFVGGKMVDFVVLNLDIDFADQGRAESGLLVFDKKGAYS